MRSVQHSGYYFHKEFSASAQLSDLYCYNSIFRMQWREKICSHYQPSGIGTSNKSLILPNSQEKIAALKAAVYHQTWEMNPFSLGT